MRNDKSTRQAEKRTAAKGTAPHGDAQLVAAGELHQADALSRRRLRVQRRKQVSLYAV